MRQLVERIRWGNVARLCAVVGVALVIAVGPRACSGGDAAAPIPPDTRVVTQPGPRAEAPPARRPEPRPKPRPPRPKKKGRHPKLLVRRSPTPPAPTPAASQPAPAPQPVPAPRAAPTRPHGRTPEFL